MNTTPLNNNGKTDPKEKGKKWTRASIAAAVAAGAITTEAANLLYAQLAKEDAEKIAENLDTEPTPDSETESLPEPEPEPIHVTDEDPEPTLVNVQETESESTTEEDPEPQPEPTPSPDSEDIVDVIVEEIDPRDIDMEDVLLVDDIGTVYTVDGRELNAAMIHDNAGNEAIMVDIDGDNVYDVITTPDGDIIAQVEGDIDVSDVELLYAQQHGDSGYMEQNDYDTAMNQEHDSIQDDISLT